MKVLLTRPEADAEGFADRLAQNDIACVLAPLLTIAYADLPPPSFDGVQAILCTSANGVRALARITQRRDVPVAAVGPSTADAARDAGFATVLVAGGDVDRLADLAIASFVPRGGRLLHVAGSVQAGDLSGVLQGKGYTVERLVAYRAVTADRLPETAVRALRGGALDGVVFFSPRTASTFATLVQEARLEKQVEPLVAFCLSQAVAEASASLRWCATRVARQPEGEMLAQLICSSPETS